MRELFPLGAHETVILRLRHHWFSFASQALVFTLYAAIPFVLWWVQRRFLPELFLDPTSFASLAAALAMSAYLLFVLQAFFTAWVDYALDVWVVTDQRIMNIAQNSLFHRTVSELSLDRVQDVTSEVKGVWATFFGFGSIIVETAGEQEHFEFTTLPRPELIAKRVVELARVYEQKKPAVTPPDAPTPKPAAPPPAK